MTYGTHGYIATTGTNAVFEENEDGSKTHTKAYQERYLNPKVESELVEFKKEIEEKYQVSELNATYKFKRTKVGNNKKPKAHEKLETEGIKPSYTVGDERQKYREGRHKHRTMLK